MGASPLSSARQPLSRRARQRLGWGLLLLMLAAGFRLVALDHAPPGLQHDEVYNAQDARSLIEKGDFRLYYANNQGREGAYIWLQGLAYVLIGENPLMIRLPALFAGMLLVALSYRFAVREYGLLAGVMTAGLLAVSFWPVSVSRVGLRIVLLPVLALIFLLALRALLQAQAGRGWRAALVAGFALGGTVYTYTAAPALWLAFGLFALSLPFIKPALVRRRWGEGVLLLLVALTLAAPMLFTRLSDPQGLQRVANVTLPLDELLAGNPQPILANALKLAGMPLVTGDPTWRYNVAERPAFWWGMGVLVYLGGALALWRLRRQPMNGMLWALLLCGLLPSLVTVLAPSFLRTILVLPVMALFVGMVFTATRRWPLARWTLALVLLSVTAVLDARALFVTWPANDEVHSIYRDDLAQLAADVAQDEDALRFVTTPDSELDPFVYEFYGADTRRMVFFNAFANVVLDEDQPRLLYVSPFSPLSAAHQPWLSPERGTRQIGTLRRQDGDIAYTLYRLGADLDALRAHLPPDDLQVRFGEAVALRGVDLTQGQTLSPRSGINLQLYLEPLVSRRDWPLNIFVHLRDAEGRIVAQRDLLGVPPRYWEAGTLIVQDHFVPFWEWSPVPPGTYTLVMGVYNWRTGERLPLLDAPENKKTSDNALVLWEAVAIP